MTKRMVGRRVVEDTPPTELLVEIHRPWWRRDEFRSGDVGDINVSITAGGVLTVATKDETISYNSKAWKRVASRTVLNRSRV